MRNWSKNALEWNLATDGNYGPHTQGGCFTCKGAVTVTSTESYIKNVAYYIIAHASKFVPAGSVRIASNNVGTVFTAAFKTPSAKIILLTLNEGGSPQTFNIKYNGAWTATTLAAGAAATYVWN